MGDEAPSSKGTYIETLESHFHAVPDITLAFSIEITDKNNNLVIEIENGALKCYYGQKDHVNVKIKTSSAVLDKIFAGERTLQGTFMAAATAISATATTTATTASTQIQPRNPKKDPDHQ